MVVGIDDLRGGCAREIPDGRDVLAADPDVGTEPWIAAAVDNAGVTNQNVEALLLSPHGRHSQKQSHHRACHGRATQAKCRDHAELLMRNN